MNNRRLKLFIVFILLSSVHVSYSQDFYGFSFKGRYKISDIVNRFPNSKAEIESLSWGYRIKMPLSSEQYHYILFDLWKYDEQSGGLLNRILISKIPIDEGNVHFYKCLNFFGEPYSGWEEVCSNDSRYINLRKYRKRLLYLSANPTDDILLITLHNDDGLDYAFDIGLTRYDSQSRYTSPFARVFHDSWSVYKKYGTHNDF